LSYTYLTHYNKKNKKINIGRVEITDAFLKKL